MADMDLSAQFKRLHDDWGEAIRQQSPDWFDRHFADDFVGTAQPWPNLRVDKKMMIELVRNTEKMDVAWVDIQANRYSDTVLVRGVVHYDREEFRSGTTVGQGGPSGDQLASLVNGRRVLYIDAWRHNGSDWQIYDHHMVGVVG